ncbi:MAG: cell division protein SepF [Actinomycetales bacterium]|nr:cell division protein SepF [Actinomycetales bacterium]
MAGALRKTMEYLGLSEPTEDAFGTDPQASDEVEERPTPRVLTPIPRVVSEPELSRIVTVHPTTYNEARQIGEAFRDGIPVIMNLTGMGEAEAKRMVDFSAGLVFGLHGVIERVTNRVFLLSPATVHVESDSREPEERSRFFNQG